MELLKEEKNGKKTIKFSPEEAKYLREFIYNSDLYRFKGLGYKSFNKPCRIGKAIAKKLENCNGEITVKITSDSLFRLVLLLDSTSDGMVTSDHREKYDSILSELREIGANEKYTGIKVDGKYIEEWMLLRSSVEN